MLAARRLATRPCSFSIARTRRFHLPRFPVPSNEPLAGTGDGAAPFSPLFLLEVGIGLPLALWAYKCLMMVALQRRIIYLPTVPPGTRSESLAEGERTLQLEALLSGLDWTERTITSSAPSHWMRKPVQLKAIELEWKRTSKKMKSGNHIVIVYLQGNAGTPLLRLPLFRRLLQPSAPVTTRKSTSHCSPTEPRITIVAAAPRSFWLSTRSAPTEATVLADYRKVIADAAARYPDAQLVLYGHSLGGAASLLLLNEMTVAPTFSDPSSLTPSSATSSHRPEERPIAGLIVENPLPSIPFMVRALYPQRWLPYHWLGPAVFDRWDARGVLSRAADRRESAEVELAEDGGLLGRIPSLWIRSGNDEIIPTSSEVKGEEGDGVEKMWEDWRRLEGAEGESRWVKIDGALHDTAYMSRSWREEVRGFLRRVATRD